MKIDKNTTLAEFNKLMPLVKTEHIETLFVKLKDRLPPKTIAGKKVPENLDLISWKQFANLSSLDVNNMYFKPFEIILKLKEKHLIECKLFDIIGFVLFVSSELQRLAKLFESIKPQPTPEEVRAGINKLNFGLFGTLDWYARRMGITDHSQAEKTPVVRIFKCMEIDNKTSEYEKRLRKIYADQNKPKNKK